MKKNVLLVFCCLVFFYAGGQSNTQNTENTLKISGKSIVFLQLSEKEYNKIAKEDPNSGIEEFTADFEYYNRKAAKMLENSGYQIYISQKRFVEITFENGKKKIFDKLSNNGSGARIYSNGQKIKTYDYVASAEEILEEFKAFKTKKMSYNKLNPQEKRVIIDKGTEAPFTGALNDHYENGTYICRQCNTALYQSSSKFKSGCGWPSFDDEIDGAVKRLPDPDGRRTEIICANCQGHLGHVFTGEGFTDKNTRHCVNSISLKFVPSEKIHQEKLANAYFAGGCFWGVAYFLEKLEGVLSAQSGYMGGRTKSPTYKEVCYQNTGHLEAVRVKYDPNKINYETLCRYFFEIHDPTQLNRQGPDIGTQYASAIFYNDETEKNTAEKLITLLEKKGYDVKTVLKPSVDFWKAEAYHQNYYKNKGGTPYCHGYTKRF